MYTWMNLSFGLTVWLLWVFHSLAKGKFCPIGGLALLSILLNILLLFNSNGFSMLIKTNIDGGDRMKKLSFFYLLHFQITK